MARGRESAVGDTRIAPNGYHYTRTESGWRLTHHIIAEQRLGRPLTADERVKFNSKNKLDFSEKNIEVVLKGKTSLRRRKAQIEARIEELKAELEYINKELQSGAPR